MSYKPILFGIRRGRFAVHIDISTSEKAELTAEDIAEKAIAAVTEFPSVRNDACIYIDDGQGILHNEDLEKLFSWLKAANFYIEVVTPGFEQFSALLLADFVTVMLDAEYEDHWKTNAIPYRFHQIIIRFLSDPLIGAANKGAFRYILQKKDMTHDQIKDFLATSKYDWSIYGGGFKKVIR
jgi:hypothetical protein